MPSKKATTWDSGSETLLEGGRTPTGTQVPIIPILGWKRLVGRRPIARRLTAQSANSGARR
jgi:hypothetical protein